MKVYLLFYDNGPDERSDLLGAYGSLPSAIMAGNNHAHKISLVWSQGRDENQIISGDPNDPTGYVISIETVQ